MNKKYDLFYHLSDIDLDGYGSQYFVSKTDENVEFFSVKIYNFREKLNEVFSKCLENKDKKIMILITDISLDSSLYEKMTNFKKSNSNIDLTFQVLDHHISNGLYEDTDWYFIDESKCSAKITCEWVLKNYNFTDSEDKFYRFVGEMVDSQDRWLTNHNLFSRSVFLADIIFNTKFLDIFEEEKREYFFYFIEEYCKLVFFNDHNISYLENMVNPINREFLKNKVEPEYFNEFISTNNLFYYWFIKMFKDDPVKTGFEILQTNSGLKFVAFFEINSTIYQYFSHLFLEYFTDIDFCVSVKRKGNLSFRSQEHCDVGSLARDFFNGGGHKNASGGKVNEVDFKCYEDFISYIKSINLI